jgi:hypothetical protein
MVALDSRASRLKPEQNGGAKPHQCTSLRIADLFGLIDDIVFQHMDVRPAKRLLQME